MMRGLERRRLFRDDRDRRDWISRMVRIFPAHGTRCFAWALMPNHVHLVLRSGPTGLSRVMARLNTGYARSFNLRHERAGYLFQNRFRSRLVGDDADLRILVRYVHLNPVKGQLVRSLARLEHFRWCGHGALVGTRPAWPFEDVDFVLGLFGSTCARARRALGSWMSDDVTNPEATCGDATLLETEEALEATCNEPLDAMIDRVSRHFGVDAEDLRGPRRARGLSEARAVIAFLAVTRCGVPEAEMGPRIGLSHSGVSRALERGAALCARERLG